MIEIIIVAAAVGLVYVIIRLRGAKSASSPQETRDTYACTYCGEDSCICHKESDPHTDP